MKSKNFINYVEFLKVASENKDKITSFKYYDNMLTSFRTNNYNYKFIFDNGVLTPNKFVSFLGFEGYSAFVNKKFSKLKEFAKDEKDINKWYSGYFGGLVGVNRHIVNNYVGEGQIFTYYDYDINQAYLYQLTQFLPTKFVCEMTYKDFCKLNKIDKIPYIYFFEITIKSEKSQFLKVIGKIKECYKSFDFLNSKQGETMVVSEKRLNLISQIYFNTYKIERVFAFEKGKFKFYDKILSRYLDLKKNNGIEFKKNALRLYGTLGQINKYTPDKFYFDERDNLVVNYKHSFNLSSSPQVAMWIADSVANYLFDTINREDIKNIICWNTDGITSLRPLGLQISKKPGKWKLNKFNGIAFLFNDCGSRLFFKDIENNKIYGATNIIEKDNNFYESVEFSYSNLTSGLVSEKREYLIDKNLKLDESKTFRNQILRRKFIENISREYELF